MPIRKRCAANCRIRFGGVAHPSVDVFAKWNKLHSLHWVSFLYRNCLKLSHVCYQVVHLLCEVIINCILPCGLIARTLVRDSNYSVLVCFFVLFCLVFWLISHERTPTLSPGDIISLTECTCGTIQKLLICSWYYEWVKNIIKSGSNGLWRATFWLRSVPVFSDVVISLSSIVLTPNGSFLVMPLLLLVSGMCYKVWWERCHVSY